MAKRIIKRGTRVKHADGRLGRVLGRTANCGPDSTWYDVHFNGQMHTWSDSDFTVVAAPGTRKQDAKPDKCLVLFMDGNSVNGVYACKPGETEKAAIQRIGQLIIDEMAAAENESGDKLDVSDMTPEGVLEDYGYEFTSLVMP